MERQPKAYKRKVSGDEVVWGAIVATVVVVVLCCFYPQFVNYGDPNSYGDQVGWGWQVGGVAIWLAVLVLVTWLLSWHSRHYTYHDDHDHEQEQADYWARQRHHHHHDDSPTGDDKSV